MDKKTGLTLLREPFHPSKINKLPKGTKAQNDCPNEQKTTCKICGGWHHPQIKHLDYVGHAALTDRLLDVDPLWHWEPMAFRDGLPAFDATGGLWIRLTVCGHSRIGYGHAASAGFKDIGSREKEVIGDALRNAAMRFGAALELWFKGDLHQDEGGENGTGEPAVEFITPSQSEEIYNWLKETGSDTAAFLKFIKGESIEKILAADYAKAIAALKAKQKKKPMREPGDDDK